MRALYRILSGSEGQPEHPPKGKQGALTEQQTASQGSLVPSRRRSGKQSLANLKEDQHAGHDSEAKVQAFLSLSHAQSHCRFEVPLTK